MKKFSKVLVVLLLSLALVACGNGKADEGGETGGDKKTIHFIVKTLGNQYWSVVEDGAKKAGEELGVEVIIKGLENEAQVEKQVQMLQDAVSAGADAIVIAPVDSVALANPISEAKKSGIPIVIIDTMAETEDYSVALLAASVQSGRDAATKMLELFEELGVKEDEEAVVGVQIGSAGSQVLIERLEGFNEVWDKEAPDTWKVLDPQVNDGDIPKAVNIAQDLLTTYPNMKGVMGANNGSTVGFATALKESNRTDVAMVGFDYSTEIQTLIRDGQFVVASVVQSQFLMGYDGVAWAVKLANGEEPSEKIVLTDHMFVTPDNVDSDDVKAFTDPS